MKIEELLIPYEMMIQWAKERKDAHFTIYTPNIPIYSFCHTPKLVYFKLKYLHHQHSQTNSNHYDPKEQEVLIQRIKQLGASFQQFPSKEYWLDIMEEVTLHQIWTGYKFLKLITKEEALLLCQQFKDSLVQLEKMMMAGLKKSNTKLMPLPYFDLHETSNESLCPMFFIQSSNSKVLFYSLDEINYWQSSSQTICQYAHNQFNRLQNKSNYISRGMSQNSNIIQDLALAIKKLEKRIFQDNS